MTDRLEHVPPPSEPANEEDVALRLAAADLAQKMVEKSSPIQASCMALTFAQQMYHAALAALRRQVDDPAWGSEDARRAAEAHLIASMRHAAKKPFERRELLQRAQSLVLPWLTVELQLEELREKAEIAEEMAVEDEERLATGVPVPWPLSGGEEDEGGLIPRDLSMIVVGHPKIVKLVLDQAVNYVRSRQIDERNPALIVCRLTAGDEATQVYAKSEQGKKKYVEVHRRQWEGNLGSGGKVADFFASWLKYMRRSKLDLLVVDDLNLASEKPSQAKLGSWLNHAHYGLRKWCDRIGSAMLVGIPLDESIESPELGDDWNMISAKSSLWTTKLAENVAVDGATTYSAFLIGAERLLIDDAFTL